MTTASDLVELTRNRYLLGGASEQRNRLAADYTAGGTTLSFTYPLNGIQQGQTISVGLNTFYVWSVNSSQQTATVSGGQRGSTDANATTGDVVTVNPHWSNFEIFNALNEELAALSAPATGLFQMRQTEITYNPSLIGYDLPGVTDVTDIYEVRYTQPDQYRATPRLGRSDFRLERGYLVGENSSTLSLKLLNGYITSGQTITVLYRAPFTPFATISSNITTTGLPTSAYDLPPMGAAIRLGAGREIRRNDMTVQGDTRRATEVTPGAVAGSWRGLMMLRQQRITDEVSRLLAQYPPRR